jgi:hypothetical protein
MRNYDDSAVTAAMGTVRREQSAAVKASHSHVSVLRGNRLAALLGLQANK